MSTDPTKDTPIDRDELGLSLAEHWAKRGIVEQHDDEPCGCDDFPGDEDIVFRAYTTAVDFILDRLAAAGLLAKPDAEIRERAPMGPVEQAIVLELADKPGKVSR